MQTSPRFNGRFFSSLLLQVLSCAAALSAIPRASGQIEGFTEPFRATELACDEAGTIAKVHVVEGQSVVAGSPIATLDDRTQRLKVELAEHLAKSNSGLDAAREALEKRDLMLSRLRSMHEKGHASESEIMRADLERSIAYSRFLAAEEDAGTREIELRRTQLDLQRRTILAPFDGIVAKIHRQEGEFLSPVKPEVALLIQTDLLLATFPIPSSQVSSLQVGQELNVKFDDGMALPGTLDSIAPMTDAESDTVQIKIKINNALRKIRSGQRCYVLL